MKFLLLNLLYITACLYAAYAQGNDWLKGTWYGERTFPDSRVAVKALLRMEVDAVHGSLFAARLIYMYPSDTSARLIRKINGKLHGKSITIVRNEEAYRMDPRSRGFWSDCSQCPGTSLFYVEGGSLILQITASNCGDTCNGEAIFSRKMEDYDAGIQAAIIRKFGGDKASAIAASYSLPAVDTSGNPSAEGKDSLKYFPKLLGDSMRFRFDPNKYVLPNTTRMDTVLTPKQEAAINKITKRSDATPQHTATKDNVAMNKITMDTAAMTAKKSTADANSVNKKDSAITAAKPVIKDSIANKVAGKDTAQMIARGKNKTPVHTPTVPGNTVATLPAPVKGNAAPATTAKDTIAALPAPVKDTVPAALTQRATSLVTSYQVNSPHIAVQLFDDGQIDGDAVSVYYNGKVIVNNQTLTHKAITFTLDATAADRHHEFILISESEGPLQPNTALMRIRAGSQQFELKVSSSSARNAKIVIDYTGE